MKDNIWLGSGIVCGAAVIGGLLYFALAPVEDVDLDSASDGKPQRQTQGKTTLADVAVPSGASRTPKKDKAKAPRKPRMQAPKDWFDKLPNAKDRALGKRIQDALDGDDQAAVLAAAEEALGSTCDDVRQSAVDALGLQGVVAMPNLLKFVGDKNKDVADAAYRAWDDAVDTVDGDLNKLPHIKQALAVVKDKEHVTSVVGKIESFDRARAIRELAKLAREDGKASEAAKELYESMVGEPFESWATAELRAIAIERDNIDASAE